NGALHVGTLDGWWDEAYRSGLGWAIGDRRNFDDVNEQDDLEGLSLYDLLEREIVPSFYERDASGLPPSWIARMRASMGGLPPTFNTDRMVHEYLSRYYEPSALDLRTLSDGGLVQARELSAWIDRVREVWPKVRVTKVGGLTETIPAERAFGVTAEVDLGT